MTDEILTALAKSMFKRAHMPSWDLSADRLWNAQDQDTRQYWLERAREVLGDLADAGVKVEEC